MSQPPPDPDASVGGWSLGGDAPDHPAPEEPPAERYVPDSLLGRGGMGVVRVARDRVVGRNVALKEVDPERAGEAGAWERLRREAAITGRLDHPGIVAVHDVGRLPDGRPFYTMRLVRGRSLAQALAADPAPAARRALVRHVLAAAEAVAAAHDAGIVHRDLKPANILIGPHGETQVVDWGLAAPTRAAAAAWADLPGADPSGVVGTPHYASPEQAQAAPPDPRHDVWSLGVTLREALGPSDVPAELAAVVSRALAPLDTRYADAEGFAADLLAWFEGRRVAAHAYTSGELVARLMRAWRVPLITGGVGLGAVILAVGWGWWGTSTARDTAVQARREAESLLARTWVEQSVEALRRQDRPRAERLAVGALALVEDPTARGVLAGFGRAERPALVSEVDGPDCAWSALSAGGEALLCGTADTVSRWEAGEVRWSRPLVATAGAWVDGGAAVWDRAGHLWLLAPEDGTVRSEHHEPMWSWMPARDPSRMFINGAVWPARPDVPAPCGVLEVVAVGARIASLCADGTLLVGSRDAPGASRRPTDLLGDHAPSALAWTPAGRLVAGTLRGGLRLLDADTGAIVDSARTDLGLLTDIVANDTLAAVSGSEGGIGLWDLGTGAWLGEVPAAPSRSFALRSDGTLLVFDGSFRTWAPPRPVLTRIDTAVGLADVTTRGDRLILSGSAGDLRIHRLPDGQPLAHYTVPERQVVKGADVGPDGSVYAVLATPPQVLTGTGDALKPFRHGRSGRRIVRLPDAVVVTDLANGLARWSDVDAEPERLLTTLPFSDLEAEPGGTALGVEAEGGIWRVSASGPPERIQTVPGALFVASDLHTLVAGRAEEVVLVDLVTGARHSIPADGRLTDIALSPDGTRVAGATLDGRAFVWNNPEGRLLAVLPGHDERISGITFLADGDVATASWDHTARLWDLSVLDQDVATLRAAVLAAYGTE